jgi:hypothetical protein
MLARGSYIDYSCLLFTNNLQVALPPNPHFILFLDKKNEARKIKTKRILRALTKVQEFLTKVIAEIARQKFT